jgi:AraC-like DNA-binding protein
VARRKFLRDLVAGTINPDSPYDYIDADSLMHGRPEGLKSAESRTPRPYLLVMLKHCGFVPGESLNVWQLSVKLQAVLSDQASIIEHIEYGAATLLYLVRLTGPTSVACAGALRRLVHEDAEMREFSVGFASPAEGIEEMQRWSGEVHEIAHSLYFSHGGDTVAATEIRQQHDFIYPEERERVMLESLLACDAAACKETIRSIIFATEAYDQIALHMTTYRTIYEIKKALLAGRVEERNVSGLAPLVTSMTRDTNVYSFPTVYALIDRLESVVDSACSVLASRRDNKRQRLVDQVDELIRTHYNDQSFHLGELARMVDLNPRYLSRVYKQETGESVPKRLARIRIEAVKEELRTTDRAIRDIAHDSGLSENPYFFRIFKDYTGTTPKQYRVLSGGE